MRAKKTEQKLRGSRIEPRTVSDALEKIAEDISPINDCRSSSEYRLHMSKVLVKRTLEEAIGRLGIKDGK